MARIPYLIRDPDGFGQEIDYDRVREKTRSFGSVWLDPWDQSCIQGALEKLQKRYRFISIFELGWPDDDQIIQDSLVMARYSHILGRNFHAREVLAQSLGRFGCAWEIANLVYTQNHDFKWSELAIYRYIHQISPSLLFNSFQQALHSLERRGIVNIVIISKPKKRESAEDAEDAEDAEPELEDAEPELEDRFVIPNPACDLHKAVFGGAERFVRAEKEPEVIAESLKLRAHLLRQKYEWEAFERIKSKYLEVIDGQSKAPQSNA